MTRLHDKIDALQHENDVLKDGLAEIVIYLYSSKFQDDNTVQVNDILIRIQEISRAALVAKEGE